MANASTPLSPRELAHAALSIQHLPPNDLVHINAAFFEGIGMAPQDSILSVAELTGLCLFALRSGDEVPQKIGI